MDFSAVNSETFANARQSQSRITLASSGVLTINGTHNDDRFSVRTVNGQTLRVTFFGVQTSDFDISDVSKVRVIARRGNDTFNNTSFVPTEFFGMEGDDLAYGGSGIDDLHGGPGQDRLEGRAGNDRLNGDEGNDVVLGGVGDDVVRGGLGNDTLVGDSGNDQLIGDAGNDIIRGVAGNDLIWGWLGDDQIQGGAGNDRIWAQQGNDTVDGGVGDDTISGGDGNDSLNGAGGRDLIFGNNGHDSLVDLSGNNNILHGGAGNDDLRTGNTPNILYGNDGNDILRGGNGRDSLYGGNGVDTLIGGTNGVSDRLEGGGGIDHVLYYSFDRVARANNDINIRLSNAGAAWSTTELLVLDKAIHRMHVATNNNRLFVDAITGDDLTFQKVPSLPGGGQAVNVLSFSTRNGVTTYDRVIKFADWDETNESQNQIREIVVPHEIGHNFDNDFELRAAGLTTNNWVRFVSRSGWTQTNPNSNLYRRSQDGQWWYLRDSEFYRSYSTISAFEDWSTVWELYFDENADRPPGGSNLGLKLAEVEGLFRRMRS